MKYPDVDIVVCWPCTVRSAYSDARNAAAITYLLNNASWEISMTAFDCCRKTFAYVHRLQARRWNCSWRAKKKPTYNSKPRKKIRTVAGPQPQADGCQEGHSYRDHPVPHQKTFTASGAWQGPKEYRTLRGEIKKAPIAGRLFLFLLVGISLQPVQETQLRYQSRRVPDKRQFLLRVGGAM